MTNERSVITLRELAKQILALPEDQQDKDAYYFMTDDRGYEGHEPVFAVMIDRQGDAAIEGPDHYN